MIIAGVIGIIILALIIGKYDRGKKKFLNLSVILQIEFHLFLANWHFERILIPTFSYYS